jgi:hypothetical protein
MIALFAYYALLVLWLPLLWPAARLAGWRRIWIAAVALLGALAALYELWATFVWLPRVVAPIRLDIPLISIALSLLYASALLVLFRARWTKLAAVLCLVLIAAGGVMTYAWISIGYESKRLTEVFRERDRLLFTAKFRDLDTYASYFGTLDARPTPHPVGHWQAEGGSRFSRLIVNPLGQAWLFYRCDLTECHYGPTGSALQRVSDGSAGWDFELETRGLGAIALRIEQEGPDRLRLRAQDRWTGFVRSVPPIDPDPPRRSLIYLGTFSDLECHGQHARVRQIWLWQEDARLYAVGLFSTQLAGRRADFVSPVFMGEANRANDAWTFEWRSQDRDWRARVSRVERGISLALTRTGQGDVDATLLPGRIFRDEVIELAATTTGDDWRAWFETVLVGHFSRADIPACLAEEASDDDTRT